ncbi:hypothetical protein DFR59_1169 [Falsibacillus pallidus]|uniref:Uncharacterized protein n=1 Tax=Falsibacillus pallidus TaxID=493781 RepID=A0A370GAH7_9BACI|nr:hypothetical protein DFR59_1169 [Falsibacillus pallidus]
MLSDFYLSGKRQLLRAICSVLCGGTGALLQLTAQLLELTEALSRLTPQLLALTAQLSIFVRKLMWFTGRMPLWPGVLRGCEQFAPHFAAEPAHFWDLSRNFWP